MAKPATLVPVERIESRILFIRGHKVLLDSDLAALYRVSTSRLNEQVKRNRHRFPSDFMFRLTTKETRLLRSQIATSKTGRGGRRYRPNAFTEHGAVMLASVLNSPVAVQASIQVVRAFVKLREFLSTHRKLALKLLELENRIQEHDEEISALFEAIRELMEPPEKPAKRIGFHS
ncbi:MAG TPA: ORF6N domain-containing protein [Candidatus Acidoferrum sp.]|nr:ORF6N domain-containing protein [Candidatus Acidoferrum sp.]